MSHFYAARGKLHLIPSLIAFMLCFMLTFHGCGAGGGGSNNTTSPTATSGAPISYSTQSGHLTQLSIQDQKSGLTGSFNFSLDGSGKTIFANGTITNATGSFSYLFDATGKLQKAINKTLGTATAFNYFPDHIEFLSLDSQGNTTSVLVLYAVSSSLILGQAQPGIPYTFNSLTNKSDITTQVDNGLTKYSAGTTLTAKQLPSFDLVSSAYAQSSPLWQNFANALDDAGFRAAVQFGLVSGGYVVGSLILTVAAGVAANGICGPLCGVIAAEQMLSYLLAINNTAYAAELIPSFNGLYTTTFFLPSGSGNGTCTHTESNSVAGAAVSGYHRWDCPPNGAGQPVNGTFTWSGALSVSSPTSADITGSGTNTGSNGFFCSFNLQSGNITLNPNGSAVMNWGAVCSGGGFFGGTSFRSS